MPDNDFSSSCGLEKLYGNALIDPANGFDRSGAFVSVITSCRSARRRCAMYLPEKPKAPVTATRTLAPHHVDRTLCQPSAFAGILPKKRCRGTAVPCERPGAPGEPQASL